MDAEDLRGTFLISVGAPESLHQRLFFDFLERLRSARAAWNARCQFRHLNFPRQALWTENRTVAKNQRMFDSVLQLSHISGPRVVAEHFQGLGGDLRNVASELRREPAKEGVRKFWDILSSV